MTLVAKINALAARTRTQFNTVKAEVATKVSKSGQVTEISSSHEEPLEQIFVTGDGTPTGDWLNRFEKYFRMNSGESFRLVQWYNEYLEWRGAPARSNTVGWRIFTKIDNTDPARNMTTPIMEMQDNRNWRNRLWALMPDGTQHGPMGPVSYSIVLDEEEEIPLGTPAKTIIHRTSDNPAYVETLGSNIEQVRDDDTDSSQWTTDFTGTLETSDTNIAQHKINGVVRAWLNEWGALRGRNPYSGWADALLRAVIDNDDTVTGGNVFELVDRRTGTSDPTNKLWGVRWQDGRMVQGGNIVGTVFTLNVDQDESDIPASLPSGTLVVKKTA